MASRNQTPPPSLLRGMQRRFGKPEVASWGKEFIVNYQEKQEKTGGGEPLRIELRVGGIEEVAVDLRAFANRTSDRVKEVTHHYGVRLRNDIRSRARELFDVTDYDQSIRLRTGRGALAVVESDEPQANRLEYGFIGTDKDGRHVEQRPRPHFRPAVARIRSEYVRAINEAITR